MRGTAVLAVAAMLAACGGGDAEPTDDPTTPAVEGTTAPAEAPTTEPEATESDALGDTDGDTGASDGDDSTEEFAKLVADGMKSVKTMKTTTESETLGGSVTEMDLSDRDNPVIYMVSDAMGATIEIVTDATHMYTRTEGSDWVKTEQDPETKKQVAEALQADQAGHLAGLYASVTLVDADERKYELKLAGGGPATDVTVWLDGDHRIAKQEVSMGSDTLTTVNEFNVPLNIPAVPGR